MSEERKPTWLDDEAVLTNALHRRTELAIAKPTRLIDEPYLAWVRTLPCRARDMGGQCMGDVVPHHRVGGGMGTKTGDRQTIPLCHYHHRARHDLNGPFKGWSRDRIREWERVEVLATLTMRLGFDGDDVF